MEESGQLMKPQKKENFTVAFTDSKNHKYVQDAHAWMRRVHVVGNNLLIRRRCEIAVGLSQLIVLYQVKCISALNVTENHTCRFFVVIFCSYQTNIFVKKILQRISQFGLARTSSVKTRSISSVICAFHLNNLQHGKGQNCVVQMNLTRCLNKLETSAYAVIEYISHISFREMIKLNDELMSTLYRSKPTKILSTRNVNIQGQMSDIMADSQFMVTIGAKLQYHVETQVDVMEN